MAGGFKVGGKLSGPAQVEAELLALKQSVRNRLLKPGLGKATRAIAKAVKAAAPVGPAGQLKRAVGSKVFVSSRRGVVGLVGARTGFKIVVDGKPVDPANYLHLAERGRKAVRAQGKALALRGLGRKGKGVLFRKGVAAAPGRFFLSSTWAASTAMARALIWEGVVSKLRDRAA